MTTGRHSLRKLLLAALIPASIAACAPDAWNAKDPFGAYLDQVRNNCWNEMIGRRSIPDLMPTPNQVDDSFMDLLSQLYYGKISEGGFRSMLEGFLGAKPDSPGVSCLIQQLPARAPKAPGLTPFSR
jgi:hypothetical protein